MLDVYERYMVQMRLRWNYVLCFLRIIIYFFINDTASTDIYTLSLHDALPISSCSASTRITDRSRSNSRNASSIGRRERSEEHTSELQSLRHLVCRLLLEKKKINITYLHT